MSKPGHFPLVYGAKPVSTSRLVVEVHLWVQVRCFFMILFSASSGCVEGYRRPLESFVHHPKP